MKKYDVISIGDAFEDILVLPQDLKVRHDHAFASGQSVSFELGEKIPLEDVDYEIGGSACNTAVAFSRLGLNSSLVTVVGDDSPSAKIFDRLCLEGVDCSHVITDKKMKTNFSVIFRLEQGRSIFIYHGLRDYNKLSLNKNLNARWFFLAPLGENTTHIENALIGASSERGSLLAWNPGAIQIKKGVSAYRELLKNISVLFLNREEAIKFLNYPVRPQNEEVLKKLQSLGPKIVVMTNGKEGVRAYDGENYYEMPAFKNVVRVDSTGAGDSLASSFLARLIIENWDGLTPNQNMIYEALRWGIVNSNSVVTKIGAQPGLLSLDQLKKGVKENYCSKV